MGKLRSSRSKREPLALRIHKRLALAASVATFAYSLGVQVAVADTTATWTSETSGNWTSTSLWSTSPNFPSNGTPIGVNYQALIKATGGAPYTISLDSDVQVSALTMNSFFATLNQTSGTFQANAINLIAGTYQLSGGAAIVDSTINVNGGSFIVNDGVLNGVTVTGGNIQVPGFINASLTIENGLTMANNGFHLGYEASVIFDGSSQTIDDLDLFSNNFPAPGNIFVGGTNSVGPVTLTLGTQAILEGTLSINDGPQAGNTLINNGTLNADFNASNIDTNSIFSLSVNTSIFTNNGVAEATNHGTLIVNSTSWTNGIAGTLSAVASTISLGGNWTNLGMISATDSSILNLGGTVTTAGIGNLKVDATSTVNITGVVDNTSATLSCASAQIFSLGGGASNGSGAAIVGGTIDNSAGNFSVALGTLDGVTVTGGDLVVVGSLTVKDGVTLQNGHQLVLEGAQFADTTVTIDGPSQTMDNLSIDGELGSAFPARVPALNLSGADSLGPVTITLGPTTTIHGILNIGDGAQMGCTLVNNGILNADTSGATGLSVNVGAFLNNGVAEASNAGVLNINSAQWTNNGTISAITGGAVNLGGNFTTADIGSISADAVSSINITGVLTNASSTLFIPPTGIFNLSGGTIIGGTVDESSGNPLNVVYGELDGVHVVGGDLNIINFSTPFNAFGAVFIKDGITIDSGHQLNLNDSNPGGESLTFDGSSQTIDNLTLNCLPHYGYSVYPDNFPSINVSGPTSVGPTTLTIGTHATVHGSFNLNNGNQSGSTLINDGTINVDVYAGTTNINVDNFTNNGLFEVTSLGVTINFNSSKWNNAGTVHLAFDSTLNLGGNFTTSGLGNITVDPASLPLPQGTVNITGTLDNSGATFSPGSSGGIWYLQYPGIIKGGIIDASNGNFSVLGGTLDGVSVVGGDVQVGIYGGGSLTVQNGLTMANHTLDLDGASVTFDGADQTIDQMNITGTGSIYPSGFDSAGPQTLTLGSNITVHNGIQFLNHDSGDALVNNGTLNGDGITPLTISLDSFTNNGLAEATSGGKLVIASANWSNSATGTISANAATVSVSGNWSNAGAIKLTNSATINLGGNFTAADVNGLSSDSTSTVNITGTMTNSSGVFTIPATGIIQLVGGAIIGGTIDESSGNPLKVNGGTLNGVHVAAGDLEVSGNSVLIQNGLTLDNGHQVILTDPAGIIFDGPNQTVDNLTIDGVVSQFAIFSSQAIGISGPNSVGPITLTLGANATLHGDLQINNGSQSGSTLVNNGTINADGSLGMSISVSNFVNDRLLEATGFMDIFSTNFTNNGTIALHNGTLFIYQGTGALFAPVPAVGIIIIGPPPPMIGELNVGTGTLTGSGTINGDVTLDSDPSTLAFNIGGETQGTDYDSLTINGTMILAGDLQITLTNDFLPLGTDIFTVLQVDSSDTLTGSFQNVPSGGRLETADGTGSFEVLYGTGQFANEIVLENFEPGSLPEPTGVPLLGIAFLSLLIRRRRRI